MVKVAAEAGFVFTAQEYEAAVKEELTKQHAAGELSAEQLETIAGGLAGKFAARPQTNACPQSGQAAACTVGCPQP